MNCYEILGVSPKAEPEVIHAVYRTLAKKYHPDNQETGDAKKFKLITSAHEILMDPAKRRAYDASIAEKPAKKKAKSASNGHQQQRDVMNPFESYREPYEDPRVSRMRRSPEDILENAAREYADSVIEQIFDNFRGGRRR